MKILIAAGGTGGHLFPAQALAKELLQEDAVREVFFAGHGLSSNRYFQKQAFPHCDISSGTLFRGGAIKVVKAVLKIAKGVKDAMEMLEERCPDLVVGFGSFHSFPVLVAAWLKKIPIILFEANSEPGKVNRLFSRRADFTAIYFPEAAKSIKGKSIEVEMPLWHKTAGEEISQEQARRLFGLDVYRTTVLIFGGSQGAVSLNRIFCEAIGKISCAKEELQVVHIIGAKDSVEDMHLAYRSLNIRACVKAFEENMAAAWKASDLVIGRSGASTIAEQILYEVPAIFIPYPYAADDHQLKNARLIQKKIKAAQVLPEAHLKSGDLAHVLEGLFASEKRQLLAMRENLRRFKNQGKKKSLCSTIIEILKTEIKHG